MTERPILFSAPMVRALLAGTKTQTRRVMARQKKYGFTDYTLFGQEGYNNGPWKAIEHAPDWPDGKEDQCTCPYASHRGDRLWVRETWAKNEDQLSETRMNTSLMYRADGEERALDNGTEKPWRPSIHMPRSASRILLEVAGLRIEQLQAISEADAIAEGITTVRSQAWDRLHFPTWRYEFDLACSEGRKPPVGPQPTDVYRALWESINGPGSWDANPWVWVIEFKRVTT